MESKKKSIYSVVHWSISIGGGGIAAAALQI
jgi:hypothetical protein